MIFVNSPQPLHILFLEDNEEDALLLQRKLEREGFTLFCAVARNLREFRERAEEAAWNLIIADYYLPGCKGTDALPWMRERHLDIPFILVSGIAGEEAAVETMRAGAHDFISKNNIARLIPAIERELKEAEIRKKHRWEEEQHRMAEERLLRIAEELPVLIFALDREERIVGWNRQAQELTGYSLQELRDSGNPLERLFPEADRCKSLFGSSLPRDFSHEELDLLSKDQDIHSITWSSMAASTPVPGWRTWFFGMDITHKKRVENQLRNITEGVIHSLVALVEVRDPYTSGHQERVATLALEMAQKSGFSPDRAEGIRIMSLVHDLGKINIPSEILCKPGKLSDIERSLIQAHPSIGYDILKNIDFPWPVAPVVLQHHERLNGSGYPQGLVDREISEEAKILAVADVVEAMSSHRPYRPALGIEAALEEIRKNRGVLYDPQAVACCEEVFNEGFFF